MLTKHLPDLRKKYSPDWIIANNENISHGKWPRMNQILWCEQQGIDIFTGGNHTLDNVEDIRGYMNQENSRQLRPDNILGDDTPGVGQRIFEKWEKKILVINLIGTAFMNGKVLCGNPFQSVDNILSSYHLADFEAILVDFHKEATAEGYAMANYLDGRASLLWGTHTHIQTADAEIWPKWLGFINDIGFAGSRRSIIGVEWESVKHRFIDDLQKGLMSPDDEGPGILSGMYAEIVDRKCIHIEPFRILE